MNGCTRIQDIFITRMEMKKDDVRMKFFNKWSNLLKITRFSDDLE